MTSSLWLYSIHGSNADLIHLLEENHIKVDYRKCFKESIKCNNNDFANYFLNNYLHNDDEKSNEIFIKSLKYYNFGFINQDHINESSFYNLCQYGYSSFVYCLFITFSSININQIIIQYRIIL